MGVVQGVSVTEDLELVIQFRGLGLLISMVGRLGVVKWGPLRGCGAK
jgi:hypothetical protein